MPWNVLGKATADRGNTWQHTAAGGLGASVLGLAVHLGAAGAAQADTTVQVAIAAGSLQEQRQTLTLGMPYVVPPHMPGAKVRTPEGVAPLLAERLANILPLRAITVPPLAPGGPDAQVLSNADALLVPLDAKQGRGAADTVVIPTGYRAGIMAIMRTDTDIRRWEDLRGRTVCLAEGGRLSGQMQARYGAIEKVFRAPADALLQLRIGGCDAAVHDSTMLEAILEFPEWQKFSARLPVQEQRDLAFVLRRGDPLVQTLQSQIREWRKTGMLAKLTKQSAHDIAFEVYMDQEVPDCH